MTILSFSPVNGLKPIFGNIVYIIIPALKRGDTQIHLKFLVDAIE